MTAQALGYRCTRSSFLKNVVMRVHGGWDMNKQRRADVQAIQSLRATDDPRARREQAVALLERSRDLEVLRSALAVLNDEQDPELRPLFHAKYAWCEEAASKRDSSGFIRADIVRALHPIVQSADDDLLRRALTTYQMQGMYELCAELRAAALRVMNDLDPDTAALFAARFLGDPLTSFSGEPAITAVRVLAAQQRLEPVFALASWGAASAQVVGEALRSLIELRADLVDLLVEWHLDAEDGQITLGLFDLLLGHVEHSRWYDVTLRYLTTTDDLDMYGIIVTSMVASRDQHLIDALRLLATDETRPDRLQLLEHALEHA